MEHNTLSDQLSDASIAKPQPHTPTPATSSVLSSVKHSMSPNALDQRYNKFFAVVAWLTERIDLRFYAPGARVPSVRQFADTFGV